MVETLVRMVRTRWHRLLDASVCMAMEQAPQPKTARLCLKILFVFSTHKYMINMRLAQRLTYHIV